MYSEKVIDHFQNPRNQGKLKDADAVGKAGNPVCGDIMHIYIKVKDDKISDIGFETLGCAAAIATSSMITELAKGMKLDEAMKITRQDVADALKGLPAIKMHCSNLAADGLHKAIENYRLGRKEQPKEEAIAELKSIGLDEKTANNLYARGFISLDELKRTDEEELTSAGLLSKDVIDKIKKKLSG